VSLEAFRHQTLRQSHFLGFKGSDLKLAHRLDRPLPPTRMQIENVLQMADGEIANTHHLGDS
jgi:hypothetical protein